MVQACHMTKMPSKEKQRKVFHFHTKRELKKKCRKGHKNIFCCELFFVYIVMVELSPLSSPLIGFRITSTKVNIASRSYKGIVPELLCHDVRNLSKQVYLN